MQHRTRDRKSTTGFKQLKSVDVLRRQELGMRIGRNDDSTELSNNGRNAQRETSRRCRSGSRVIASESPCYFRRRETRSDVDQYFDAQLLGAVACVQEEGRAIKVTQSGLRILVMDFEGRGPLIVGTKS